MKRAEYLTAAEVCVTTNLHKALKGRTFDSSGFSAEGILISACTPTWAQSQPNRETGLGNQDLAKIMNEFLIFNTQSTMQVIRNLLQLI